MLRTAQELSNRGRRIRGFLVPRTAAVVLTLVAAMILNACGAPSTRQSAATQSPPVVRSSVTSATASALAPSRQFALHIDAGSIQPAKLTLPLNAGVRLLISNSGPACEFSAGDYLRGLTVLQGEVVEAGFVVTSLPAGVPASSSPSPLGCAGDSKRQAQFAVAPTASNPNGVESRAAVATPVAGVREIGFDLQPDSMRPHEVDLPYNARAHLMVVNHGGACLFSFGDYLRGLLVPAGGSADVTLTVSGRVSGSTTPSPNPPIGCAGDAQRQGLLALPGATPASGTPARPTASPTATPTTPR